MAEHEVHEPFVSMRGITKRFPGTLAVDGVDLDIFPGEVHVLAGENGAGKSTLIKILAGAYPDYRGEITIGGRSVKLSSPLEASALGIAAIHQELSLIRSMSVTENIFLADSGGRWGFIDTAFREQKAREVLSRLGLEIDVTQPVENYPIATQQLIEIGKALAVNARVFIMDEPTSALDAQGVKRLFDLIRSLVAAGCGIVYISHKMEEIEEIADRITVLRDGRLAGTSRASEVTIPQIITWMVGRRMDQLFPRHAPTIGAVRFSASRCSVVKKGRPVRRLVHDVSFEVRSGEILGLAGLRGSGGSELLLGIFGEYGRAFSGELRLDGKRVCIRSPREAIRNGIALLTSDRKETGLVLTMSITANLVLPMLRELSVYGFRVPSRERKEALALSGSVRIKAHSIDSTVDSLSGGNQQKVALAKWIFVRPGLLLLDEPTRGIDIGAKLEIYRLLNDLTLKGMAVVMISSELPELLALSDRILVLHRGEATAEFSREEATSEKVLEAAMGKRSNGKTTPGAGEKLV